MSAQADKVLRITTKYLGPASRVFLERQTKYHMGGLALADVRPEHLPRLIYWVKVGSELIIKEKSQPLVAQLMEELHVAVLER
jgi:hypothetical protein